MEDLIDYHRTTDPERRPPTLERVWTSIATCRAPGEAKVQQRQRYLHRLLVGLPKVRSALWEDGTDARNVPLYLEAVESLGIRPWFEGRRPRRRSL